MATRMQQRRGTAAQWTTANPILAAGEIGFETDNNKFKIGDGVNHWDDLSYFTDAASIAAIIDDAPALMDTLNEISAALGDDPDFVNTIGQQISTINNSLTLLANIDVVEGIDNALQAHEASSISVHGIGNTAELITETVLSNSLTNLETSLQTNIDNVSNALTTAEGTLQDSIDDLANVVSDHEALQLSVHGITNTQNLVYTSDSRLSDERTPSNGSVTTAKIVNSAVETAKIADENVTTGKLANNAVTNAKMADDSVDTAEIKDGAVTNAKLAGSIAQSKITNLETDLAGKQAVVSGVSDTEIGYLDGVTSAIQTQLDAKAAIAGAAFTGNVSTTGSLTVDGDLIVNGSNVVVSSTQIQIEDTMIQLGHTNSANSTDLGLFASYNDGTQKHTGLVKDVTDGKWKLFDGVTTEPGTTVDFSQGSFDNLKIAALEATTITPSSGVVFSDGTQTKAGVPSITTIANAISSSATLASGEQDKFVPISGTATITLPSSGYSIGQSIDFYQSSGTGGQFAGTGVVGTPGLKLRTTYSVATAMKIDGGWLVFGDLSA
jgi:hypothetical protein